MPSPAELAFYPPQSCCCDLRKMKKPRRFRISTASSGKQNEGNQVGVKRATSSIITIAPNDHASRAARRWDGRARRCFLDAVVRIVDGGDSSHPVTGQGGPDAPSIRSAVLARMFRAEPDGGRASTIPVHVAAGVTWDGMGDGWLRGKSRRERRKKQGWQLAGDVVHPSH